MLIRQVWLLHLPNPRSELVSDLKCGWLFATPTSADKSAECLLWSSWASSSSSSQLAAKIGQLLQNRMCCHLIIIMLQKWPLEGFNFPFSCVKPLFGSCSQEAQTFRTPEPSNSYLSLTSGGSVTFYNTYDIWKRGETTTILVIARMLAIKYNFACTYTNNYVIPLLISGDGEVNL